MALDQHGTLLKMVVMVSQHHFTGRPCWSWLSWFICLSSRLWADAPPWPRPRCPARRRRLLPSRAPALPEAPARVQVLLELCGRQGDWTLRDTDEIRLLARLEAVLTRVP